MFLLQNQEAATKQNIDTNEVLSSTEDQVNMGVESALTETDVSRNSIRKTSQGSIISGGAPSPKSVIVRGAVGEKTNKLTAKARSRHRSLQEALAFSRKDTHDRDG